jgi:hypothetical protein
MKLHMTGQSVKRPSLRRSLGLSRRVKVDRQGVTTTWYLDWETHNILHVSRFSLGEGRVTDVVNVSDPHVTIID